MVADEPTHTTKAISETAWMAGSAGPCCGLTSDELVYVEDVGQEDVSDDHSRDQRNGNDDTSESLTGPNRRTDDHHRDQADRKPKRRILHVAEHEVTLPPSSRSEQPLNGISTRTTHRHYIARPSSSVLRDRCRELFLSGELVGALLAHAEGARRSRCAEGVASSLRWYLGGSSRSPLGARSPHARPLQPRPRQTRASQASASRNPNSPRSKATPTRRWSSLAAGDPS